MCFEDTLSELDCCKAELTAVPRVMMGLGTVMLHLAQVGWHCLGFCWPVPFNHPVTAELAKNMLVQWKCPA